jgi:hypothetical protein
MSGGDCVSYESSSSLLFHEVFGLLGMRSSNVYPRYQKLPIYQHRSYNTGLKLQKARNIPKMEDQQ